MAGPGWVRMAGMSAGERGVASGSVVGSAVGGDVPVAGHVVRRGELSAFLRSRRERIGPAEVGLPVGSRRRTPGLRREEVAQLAGVGVTWYTWLEQGRPIKASAQVLDAVARTLRMDVPEREHLYRLAGIPSVALPEVGDCVSAEVPVILAALDPLPAAVYNARWDVLAWNASYAALFPSVTMAPRGECNVMWHVFTGSLCCSPFVDAPAEMPRLVASLRPAFGRHIGEPAWSAFVARLCAASGEFAAMWARQDVAAAESHVKRMRHPDLGELRLMSTQMALAVPETRMTVYTSVDEATRAELLRLRSVPWLRTGCPEHGYRRYRNPVGPDADGAAGVAPGVSAAVAVV